jgi:hypothetical protein
MSAITPTRRRSSAHERDSRLAETVIALMSAPTVRASSCAR